MSTLSRLFKYLVLTALLAACASAPNATPPGDGPGEAPPMSDLAGTHWSLVSLNGRELAPDTFISLEIAYTTNSPASTNHPGAEAALTHRAVLIYSC